MTQVSEISWHGHDYKQVQFTVFGKPAPKGSYRTVRVRSKKTGRMTNRFIPMSKNEHPWRQAIVNTIRALNIRDKPTVGQPISIAVVFYLQRPKSISVKVRPYPTEKPDIDKLCRSTFDGLTDSGLIPDDKYIVDASPHKRYCVNPQSQGATIVVTWGDQPYTPDILIA